MIHPPKSQIYPIIYNTIDDRLAVKPILRPTSVVRDIYFQDRAAAACRSCCCLALADAPRCRSAGAARYVRRRADGEGLRATGKIQLAARTQKNSAGPG